MTLADRIKQLGLSKAEFATLVHTAPSSASRWFHGQRAEPHWIASWLDMYEMLTCKKTGTKKLMRKSLLFFAARRVIVFASEN